VPDSAGSSLYEEIENNARTQGGVVYRREQVGCSKAPSVESCLDAMFMIRGEGLSGREP
jgi:hypothetical protein